MATLVVAAIPLFLIAIFILNRLKLNRKPANRDPPGPPRLPFIGNLHQLDTRSLHTCLGKLAKTYGPVMLLKLGALPALVVSSAKMAEEVLKNQDAAFCSRPQMRGQQVLSYDGIDIAFAPYGQEWRERRKISVLHLLSAKRNSQFRPIREDGVARTLRKLRKDAETGAVSDLSELMVAVTNSMICWMAFGKKFGEDEKGKFDGLQKEIQAAFIKVFIADYFPSIGWLDYLTGMNSRLSSTFRKLDSFYQQLIDEHLHPNRPSSMDGDFIDLMLQLQRDGSTPIQITMNHIKAFLMNILLGGTDTVAATVVWAMTSLIRFPETMEKLKVEIREVMGEKEIVEEEDLENLPYLKATVKETMRLHPVGPLLLPRATLTKCELDGYEIQPKTLVYVNAWAIARDPEVWEEPLDFCPERFLSSKADVEWQNFNFLPFGSGKRSCPGYGMGIVAVYVLLANILHSFDWELPDGVKKEDIDTEHIPGLAVFKKNHLKLVPRIRARAGNPKP